MQLDSSQAGRQRLPSVVVNVKRKRRRREGDELELQGVFNRITLSELGQSWKQNLRGFPVVILLRILKKRPFRHGPERASFDSRQKIL